MKTLYLDCSMGAAGDMLGAALLDLMPEPERFVERLNSIGIPGVSFAREDSVKCGIKGAHLSVKYLGMEEGAHGHHSHDHENHSHEHGHHSHDHEHHSHDHENHSHHHSSMHDIEHVLSHMSVSDKIRSEVLSVYRIIAEAESHVHGVPVDQIHFHELGMMDAVADISAVCMLMDELSPDNVAASPINVGSGQVRCAHGILPVPAPATAFILKDMPVYGSGIKGELCTPTGAALLKHFVRKFGEMPAMKMEAVSYGMGMKDFERANCLRAVLGESEDAGDRVLELSCNVDDMTAEDIGFAMERLFEAGAREVYTVPVGMKKSRPGTLICVICYEDDRELMIREIFKHTSTIGIRETSFRRHVLSRTEEKIDSPYGQIRCKKSSGYGVSRRKYEYDDLAAIAREHSLSLDEIRRSLP